MHFRHKIATEALVYSFLLYQFQYMPKRVAFNVSLTATKHLPADHWGIYMALHTSVAVCPCLFSSTQMWMFFMRMAAFLYSTCISV